MVEIRTAVLSDLPGLYRVCQFTADPAWPEGIPGTNPDLLGHVYAGPYAVHSPDLAGVVADSEGVAGYILGCADTDAFSAWCEREWWPRLREQYPRGSGSEQDREAIELFYARPEVPQQVLAEFPAHLHIDLLPRLQGTGAGRVLMEWLLSRLRARGVTGVHLGVSAANTNAIGFYEHLGFATLWSDDDGRLMTHAL